MSATELMARLENDKDYQREKATFDGELQDRTNALREADLRRTGVQVGSVWHLVNTAEPSPGSYCIKCNSRALLADNIRYV